jgi:DNA mismatch repair protein MutS
MAVKEWQDQIIFLHAVMDGHAAGSYGIHVARLAGLPELVTTRAEQILEGFEKKEMGPSALEKTSPSGWAEGPVPQKTFGSCPKAQKLIDDLAALEVDALSPREALEILYQLKSNLENNKG